MQDRRHIVGRTLLAMDETGVGRRSRNLWALSGMRGTATEPSQAIAEIITALEESRR